MKDRQTFLAFDLGATSGRGVAGSIEDERLVVKEVYRFANEPVRVFNGYYRDVLHHFIEMKRFLTVASREYGDHIRTIGIDTAGVAYALLDADGMLIENPGNYTHNRIEGMDKRVFELMPREEIFEHTGALSSGNAIYQLFSLVYHKSPILNLVKTFVMMPGLFTY